MADITIVTGVYKPTNITGGHHPVIIAILSPWLSPAPNAAQNLTRTSASMRGRSKSWVGCLAEQDRGRRRWMETFFPDGDGTPKKPPVGFIMMSFMTFSHPKIRGSSWFIMIKIHKNSNKHRWTYPTVDKSLVILHDIHVSILSFA